MSIYEDEMKAERERQQGNVDRQFELAERDIAVKERLVQMTTAPAFGDGPGERLTAFFELPRELQDFKLREECAAIACRIGGDIDTVLVNADRILAYIRGGEQ